MLGPGADVAARRHTRPKGAVRTAGRRGGAGDAARRGRQAAARRDGERWLDDGRSLRLADARRRLRRRPARRRPRPTHQRRGGAAVVWTRAHDRPERARGDRRHQHHRRPQPGRRGARGDPRRAPMGVAGLRLHPGRQRRHRSVLHLRRSHRLRPAPLRGAELGAACAVQHRRRDVAGAVHPDRRHAPLEHRLFPRPGQLHPLCADPHAARLSGRPPAAAAPAAGARADLRRRGAARRRQLRRLVRPLPAPAAVSAHHRVGDPPDGDGGIHRALRLAGVAQQRPPGGAAGADSVRRRRRRHHPLRPGAVRPRELRRPRDRQSLPHLAARYLRAGAGAGGPAPGADQRAHRRAQGDPLHGGRRHPQCRRLVVGVGAPVRRRGAALSTALLLAALRGAPGAPPVPAARPFSGAVARGRRRARATARGPTRSGRARMCARPARRRRRSTASTAS